MERRPRVQRIRQPLGAHPCFPSPPASLLPGVKAVKERRYGSISTSCQALASRSPAEPGHGSVPAEDCALRKGKSLRRRTLQPWPMRPQLLCGGILETLCASQGSVALPEVTWVSGQREHQRKSMVGSNVCPPVRRPFRTVDRILDSRILKTQE